ncbi:efflux RND transporter periplasmic adaptor subunit [uncultured Rhodoblastus sp.]|uniref:efflux RND transporter periplasmic adaptor subunit n=1 Tax=uncultured Rhodoblastus sp. TaxID=543037 RepID=UPI0025FDF443|nr:efflux RND transporter periplasmic adaptor subunit [uncultured Rhodoblastus sp.]
MKVFDGCKREQRRAGLRPGAAIGAFLWKALAPVALLAAAFSMPAAAQMPPPVVITSKPLSHQVQRWEEFSGHFEAVKQVEVRSRVSGLLEKICFADGDLVKQGDVLFEIEPKPFQIAVDGAKADVERARAQLIIAERDFQRGQTLATDKFMSTRDIDQRRLALDVAKAQFAAAGAALENAELNLEWTRVRAPISGRVSDRRVDAGNFITQGGQMTSTLLTTIVTLDPIHFVFEESEFDYLRGKRRAAGPGNAERAPVANIARIRLADETEWSHQGAVNFMDNQVNQRSGTIRGRVVLPNPGLMLTPGVFGHVQLLSDDRPALLVPDVAIVSDQTSKLVMVVGPDRTVAARAVKLGPIFGGLRIVESGLADTDEVIVGGLANPMVRPGVKVETRPGEIHLASN